MCNWREFNIYGYIFVVNGTYCKQLKILYITTAGMYACPLPVSLVKMFSCTVEGAKLEGNEQCNPHTNEVRAAGLEVVIIFLGFMGNLRGVYVLRLNT